MMLNAIAAPRPVTKARTFTRCHAQCEPPASKPLSAEVYSMTIKKQRSVPDTVDLGQGGADQGLWRVDTRRITYPRANTKCEGGLEPALHTSGNRVPRTWS